MTATAGIGQGLDGLQPLGRSGGARFHLARDAAIERGHGDGDLDEVPGGHSGEDVDIAHHQGRLGNDADRMAGAVEHLEDGPGYEVLALDRLVGVGDRAKRNVFRHVARVAELLLQQRGGVDLGVQLGLEIEAGGVAQIAVRWAGEAIDAAVLAAAVGVDRLIEADVRAVIAGNDALGDFLAHVGLEGFQIAQALPTVVEGLALLVLVAADAVGARAAAAPAFCIHECRVVGHGRPGLPPIRGTTRVSPSREQSKN
jgi:hypothetical protein